MKRSTPTTYGLAICVLLGVIDIISLAQLGSDDGPPVGVILTRAVGRATRRARCASLKCWPCTYKALVVAADPNGHTPPAGIGLP